MPGPLSPGSEVDFMGGPRSRFAHVLIASSIAAVLWASSLAPADTLVRWDDPEAGNDSLTGYLTWNGDQRRISWSATAPSQDDQPPLPSDEVQTQRSTDYKLDAAADTAGRDWGFYETPPTSGQHFTDPIADDVFESDPLPRRLVLNASQGLQLTLFLKIHPDGPVNPCDTAGLSEEVPLVYRQWSLEPLLEVEVTVDGKPLGGGYGDDRISWKQVYPLFAEPELPEGYGACYFQMHSERHILEADSVLKLRVRHVKQQYFYPFGLAGDHRSHLRISLLPVEDVFYRFPELEPQRTIEGVEDVGGTAGFAVVGLFALAFRPRHRAGLLALLAVAGAFAGCLGGDGGKGASGDRGAPPLQGDVENTFIKDEDGTFSDVLTGAILGRVRDDLGLPVGGVHVSLLGSAHFTGTDAKGFFQFIRVPVGHHKVRFDHEAYHGYEAPVEVKASFISRPDFTLYLKNPLERDSRMHPHDYWPAGVDAVDLGTFQVKCDEAKGGCWNDFDIPPQKDVRNMILPGTSDVEVTMTWEKDDLKADRLGLHVFHNGDGGNWTTFMARGPGEPFHIATMWEETDAGHGYQSNWLLRWFVPASEERTWQEQRDREQPGYVQPPITVHVAIKRGGALPLERAHPDHWKGKNILQVVTNNDVTPNASPLPPMDSPPEELCQGRAMPMPRSASAPTGSGLATCDERQTFNVDYPKVIPDDTKWLEVRMNRDRAPEPVYEWDLYYKPANVPLTLSDEGTRTGYATVPRHGSSSATVTVWRVPIVGDQGDSPYVDWSKWRFVLVPTDRDSYWQDYWTHYPGDALEDDSNRHKVNAFAHRDALP